MGERRSSGLGEHMTRLMRAFKPSWRRPTFWVLVGLLGVMVLWQIDTSYDGIIHVWASRAYVEVLKAYPPATFALGMLASRVLWREDA